MVGAGKREAEEGRRRGGRKLLAGRVALLPQPGLYTLELNPEKEGRGSGDGRRRERMRKSTVAGSL